MPQRFYATGTLKMTLPRLLLSRRSVSTQKSHHKFTNSGQRQAGLSQKQLAELVGTTQSVISRLEDADYTGHSLDMLSRIAAALHFHLQVKLVPNKRIYALG
jgi:ribosome-binding protein aMBF1 (putative translation factor)